MSVQIKCKECGEISEIPVEEWKIGKREGTIQSSRGRYDYWTCEKHKGKNPTKNNPPSRGKAEKSPKPKKAKPEKPTKPTQNDRHKKSPTKQSTAKQTSSGIYTIDSEKFPSTIMSDGREFVLVLPFSGRDTKYTVEELGRLSVDSKVAVNSLAQSAVYADAKTFKYIYTHIRGHGTIIVYKDINKPIKQIEFQAKGGRKTLHHLFRIKGTAKDIERKLFEMKSEANYYYKGKVFGAGGKYKPSTYDVFVDDEASKERKQRKRKLSSDYEKFVKKMGYDPHCNACTDTSCPNVGMGDDACPAFRSGL